MTNPLIASLAKAVEAAPTDVALRLHLAEMLLADGQLDVALGHCATALQQDPASGPARALMGRALGGIPQPPTGPPAEATPVESAPAGGFDWKAAESEVEGLAPEPLFVHSDAGADPEVGAWDVERGTGRLADVGGKRAGKERHVSDANLQPPQTELPLPASRSRMAPPPPATAVPGSTSAFRSHGA